MQSRAQERTLEIVLKSGKIGADVKSRVDRFVLKSCEGEIQASMAGAHHSAGWRDHLAR